MTVKITNLSQSALTITLYHKYYCDNGASCKCEQKTLTRSSQKKDGASGRYRVEKLMPASIRIGPKVTVTGLHAAVSKLPHVQSLLKSKPPAIRVTQVAEKSPKVTKEVKITDKNTVPKEEEAPADAPLPKKDKAEPRSTTRRRSRARSSNKEKLDG